MTDYYREYIKAGAIGLEVGLSIIVGAGLGYFAERYFDISPWGLLLGAGFGMATAGRTLYRFSKRYLKDNP
ncbi:MAG: AtpZ/AtpI family protein [Myxococcaceae bacterium]